jgi:hypothetical protein
MERPAWLISTLLATGLAIFVVSNLVQDWLADREAKAEARLRELVAQSRNGIHEKLSAEEAD